MEAEVEQNSIWRYEAGRRIPSAAILHRLALAYGKSLDWLLEGLAVSEERGSDEEASKDQTLIAIGDRQRVIYNEILNALNNCGVVLSEQSKLSIAHYAGYVALNDVQEESKPPSFE